MEIVPLVELNTTELIEIARLTRGVRVTGSREQIITFLEAKGEPIKSKFNITRERLENYLKDKWSAYSTNMPCNSQPLAGKCTKFGCSDFIHSGCYLGLKGKLEEEGTNAAK